MPKYSLSTDGKILADNQTIGYLHGDAGEFTTEIELHATALNMVKALIYDRMMKHRKDQADIPRGNPLQIFREEETHEQAASLLGPLTRDEYASSQPPPPPRMDPRLGDKTPAYMQWLGENFPDEYRKRYSGRRTHLTTGINPHLFHIGDIPESDIVKEATEEWK